MWRGMWICGVMLCLLLPACSSRKPPTPTQNFVNWSQQAAPHKKQLCVLPYENASHVDELDEKVRQGVAGHLSVKRFTDVELHEIDARLAGIGQLAQTGAARPRPPTQLRRARLRSRLKARDTIYAGVYSQLALIGTLRVVGVASGDVLLHETYATRLHGLGLPLSPVGLATSMVRNLWTFTDTRFVRAIDDLSRNLAALVPDLPETGASTSTASQKQDSAVTRTGSACKTPPNLPGSSGVLSLARRGAHGRPGSCTRKAMRPPLPRWQECSKSGIGLLLVPSLQPEAPMRPVAKSKRSCRSIPL